MLMLMLGLSLLSTGIGITALPMILLYVLIFVVFLLILYGILSFFTLTASYARITVLIVGGVILLLFLINLASGGAVFGR